MSALRWIAYNFKSRWSVIDIIKKKSQGNKPQMSAFLIDFWRQIRSEFRTLMSFVQVELNAKIGFIYMFITNKFISIKHNNRIFNQLTFLFVLSDHKNNIIYQLLRRLNLFGYSIVVEWGK